jgi:hypothetical protein
MHRFDGYLCDLVHRSTYAAVALRVLFWGFPAAAIVAAVILGSPIRANNTVNALVDSLGNSSYTISH